MLSTALSEQVDHALARLRTWKTLCDYRRTTCTSTDTASGIAHLHNIALTA